VDQQARREHGLDMNLFWAALVVAAVSAVAITAMLLVRRRAPQGSYFEDGDRAAGVFGVLATGFAVLLGFVVFLAFESFETSRSGAEREPRILAEQFETAQLMPVGVRGRFSGQLVCYARSVINQEWPKMESGSLDAGYNRWGVAMFRTLKTTKPNSVTEQAAYSKWLDQRTDREDARADRTHGAQGVIPIALWIVLFLSAGVIFVFMLFFADSGERAVVQATMMGSVAIVITSTLLLLWFLDNPYHHGLGGLRPTAMEQTLALLTPEAGIADGRFETPCDSRGVARAR
jgi:succinate dehydrogenase/fumarate reductase cytochrome b subunit